MSTKRIIGPRRAALLGAIVVSGATTLSLAVRPNLQPGESNWQVNAGPGTLPTVDLTTALTPTDMVNALLGAGVTASNVVYTGANIAGGTFSGGTGIIGFESGIILSSGNIASVAGAVNQLDGTTTNNGLPGDADLSAAVAGASTFDATVLEFDFECTGVQTIQFQYVFTSEEYNEYVFGGFNDVFGFFLNGVNIALVPGAGATPVSIDNVNCDNPYNPPAGGNNCFLYRNNDCDDIPPNAFPCTNIETEMDGLTEVFTASGTLLPGVNHIKLAIADAGDEILDSNVFIRGESFLCALPTGGCCNRASFSCQEDVLEADCAGPNDEWFSGIACAGIQPPCIAPTGACCGSDPINPNIPVCEEDVTQADCEGSSRRYGGDGSTCATIDPPCILIPAVSEWGLVVLTLIGLAAGTIVFGRLRRRATA